MRSFRLGILGVSIVVVLPLLAFAETSCPQLTKNLSFGSRGADVVRLQQYLISQNLLAPDFATGFDGLTPSGYFGKLTEAGVQQWQSSHGVASSGTAATTGFGAVGPKTRAALAAACSGGGTSVPSTSSGQANPNQSLINSLLAQAKVLQDKLAQLIAARSGGSGGGGGGSGATVTTTTTASSCTWNGSTLASGSSVTAYQSLNVAYGSQCVSETRTCTNGTLSGSYANAACSVASASAASCTFAGQSITNGLSVTAYRYYSPPSGQYCSHETRTCTNGTLSGSGQYLSCTTSGSTAGQCAFSGQSIANGTSVKAYQYASVSSGQYCQYQERTCTNGTLSGSYQYLSCASGGSTTATSCTFNGQTVASGSSVTAYQASSVPVGQTCVSQTRACTNGTLSGSYTNAACTVATVSAPAGYSLLNVYRSYGNCSDQDQGYYGPYTNGVACTNQQHLVGYNLPFVGAYKVTVQAKAGDIMRITGSVTMTNDGNAQALAQEQAVSCAQAMGDAVQYDPVTGIIVVTDFGSWGYNEIQKCNSSPLRPAWITGNWFTVGSPTGLRMVPDQAEEVVQLVLNGQHMLGGRVYQLDAIDWSDNRKCLGVGQNCRGHLSTQITSVYTAPTDGSYSFEVQGQMLTGTNLRIFTIEAGGGQLIVEHFRKYDPAHPAGYGLVEVQNTDTQLISSYRPASCAGNDQASITADPNGHTIFKLSTQAAVGDIVRTWVTATGLSSQNFGADASALGIWRTNSAAQTLTYFVAKAWGLHGTSVYYPWGALHTDSYEKISTAGSNVYWSTLHSSNTPPDCAHDSGATLDPITGQSLGGLVQPGTGSMNLMRYSPIQTATNAMTLQSVQDFTSSSALTKTVVTNGAWHTLFRGTFNLAKDGAVAGNGQVVLRNSNGGDAATPITCLARVYLPNDGLQGGVVINGSYNATDDLFIRGDIAQTLPAGAHTFQFQVQCTASGQSKILVPVDDSMHADMAVFSR